MFQNSVVTKNRYKKFIQEVTENEIVWSLKSTEGYVTSSSNKFEDDDGEPLNLFCFWSNRKLASVCAKRHWKEYEPTKITLPSFLENWCTGMYLDNDLAGINFDWNLFGQESDPVELAIEISEALQKIDKDLEFKKFNGIEDFKLQAKDILEDEN